MRKFNVNVNGKNYAVEVEEIGGATVATAPVATTQATTAVAPKAAPAPAAAPAGGKAVNAPMPGLVKKLCFDNGATVKEGDTIVILEAMKMDTPVVASASGVITYSTTAGTNVDTGAVLCTIA